jgi:hypothetical protein
VDRVAFLIDILACRKVHWIMEQPLNSLLWAMPAMRRAEKVSGQQLEVAAPVHLDGSLWAFLVEAHGVGRLFSGNGDGLANKTPIQARDLLGLPPVG